VSRAWNMAAYQLLTHTAGEFLHGHPSVHSTQYLEILSISSFNDGSGIGWAVCRGLRQALTVRWVLLFWICSTLCLYRHITEHVNGAYTHTHRHCGPAAPSVERLVVGLMVCTVTSCAIASLLSGTAGVLPSQGIRCQPQYLNIVFDTR
jgi:hypothetical protein